jgi:flagellar biosynthesis/type III secretory pathway M-ring protein FliF/YscJ
MEEPMKLALNTTKSRIIALIIAVFVIMVIVVAVGWSSYSPSATSILQGNGYTQVSLPSSDFSQISQYATSYAVGTNTDGDLQVVIVLKSQDTAEGNLVVSIANSDGLTATENGDVLTITGTTSQWESLNSGSGL